MGKGDSDATVCQAMGSLHLGLGRLRKWHPNLPCALIYYGQVYGTRTRTSYEAGSGVVVFRGELAQVGLIRRLARCN
jgi:hypothetical protein